MNWTIFKAALTLRRISLAWYSVGLIAYGWMIIAFFPLIAKNPAYTELAQEMFSEEMLAAFGGAGLQLTTLGGFLGIEYLSLMWVLIVGAAVIIFAAGQLAGAVEDGTMEVTLSQPVSRVKVALTRYLAMMAYAVALCLVTTLSLYVTGFIHGVDVPVDSMLLLFFVSLLLALAMGGLAFAISAMTTGGGRTIGVSFGVIVAMYLADLLGNLNSDYAWLSKMSLFHYWEPHRVIDDLEVASATWLVFGIASAAFFAVGMYAFQKRDVV
ncbi:MAG: ABC transporter permease subunit [Actinobacteria bacterium]|nr:ABC transporter permease subunit [Actinomycetota bacterium]